MLAHFNAILKRDQKGQITEAFLCRLVKKLIFWTSLA